ncbi:hypothetical protein [Jannaschia seohaensis]|uniref:Sel1 repeat-containing protein n=1 Tax=Jannaschia seohaensis TaxID=475081 RepID=A0A2Y9AR59_9RHOB|nr:hypothetical protein [Jannaschia seohaensis]PWJ18042.1 hypothetical protein BCF38_10529 [Jannaschia seohaensis]SSA46565.1 hypothetical protein SAMN05421539_10529 [Jannaschia seohaensis]
MTSLNDALLDAHAQGDGPGLVGLYQQAAEQAAPDAAAFFLTQAWIFALEAGDVRAARIEQALRAQGRA